jgi:copper transport protein
MRGCRSKQRRAGASNLGVATCWREWDPRSVFLARLCRRPARYVVSVLVFLLCAFGRNVEAHALLQRSLPENGSLLEHAPDAVVLTFTEQPEPTLSVIHVLDSSGRAVEAAGIRPVGGQPLALRLPLQGLSPGVYTVSWRTVSRVDGHVAGGVFSFGVGVAPPRFAQPQASNPPPSGAYVVSRLLLYAGLSGLVAAAIVGAAARVLPAGLLAYAWMFWASATVGLVLLGLAEALDTGAGVNRLLRTALGHALWWRAAPIAAAGLAIAIGQRGAGLRRSAPAALGVAVGAAMLAQVLAGHAGADTGLRRFWNVLVQWTHFAGVGVWAGALATMVLAVRTGSTEHRATAVRCSLGAAAALGAVGVTGAIRAVDEVGTWPALFSTPFGRLVLLKAGLFAALAMLGAFGRDLTLSSKWEGVRLLYFLVGAEMVVAAGALAVTGFLTGLAPTSVMQEAVAAPAISIVGSDYATSVRVRLTVVPALPGINRFTAAITDYDTQRPVAADRVTLRFTKPDRADLGPSSLLLSRTPAGRYEGEGSNISFDGHWAVVVVVERQNQSVEVPLKLTTTRAAQTVRTIQVSGRPPVYVIALARGRALSIYLDPGKVGFNALHGTFVDAQGRELILVRAPEITVAHSGAQPRSLPTIQEGPGHFSSDADFGPGEWQLEIVATTRTGETLRAQLTVHL